MLIHFVSTNNTAFLFKDGKTKIIVWVADGNSTKQADEESTMTHLGS